MKRIYAPLFFGGGVLKPASIPDLAQWLVGLKDDGETLNDKLSPLVVDPEPTTVNSLAVDFDGSGIIKFDGSNQADFQLDKPFTLNYPRVRFDSLASNHMIAANRRLATTFEGWYFGYLSGDSKLIFIFIDSATQGTKAGWDVSLGVDYDIELDYDGSGSTSGMTLKLNGVEQTRTDFTNDASGVINYSASTYSVGSRSDGSQALLGEIVQAKITKNESVNVVLLLGQSNCRGAPISYGTLPVSLQSDQIHKFSDVSGGYNKQLAPLSSTSWGVEITAGDEVTQELGGDIFFIKVGIGSTTLAVDWQKGGSAYTSAATIVSQALLDIQKLGVFPVIRELWWIQGETDARTQTYADNYEANFDTFIADFNSDMGIGGYYTVISRIHDTLPDVTYPYKAEVRSAQDTLGARVDSELFDTDSYEVGTDDVHFSSEGLQPMGRDIVEHFLANYQSTAQSSVVADHHLTEGIDGVIYDASDYAVDGTTTLPWAAVSTYADHLLNGFDLWNRTADNEKLYVTLNDNGESVRGDGDTITGYTWQSKHPGCANNYAVHNGSECGLVISAYFDGWVNMYNPTGAAKISPFYWSDYFAHESSAGNGWIKWRNETGPCIVKEAYQYKELYVSTSNDYNKNARYVGAGGGCGSIAPFI